MGITVVQKSDLSRPKKNSRICLVLAGGAVTGGAFKVGGLQALDSCLVGRKVNDFDIFIGLSAGSIIATLLANGISPEEMLRSFEGEETRLDPIHPLDVYRPNFEEFLLNPLRFVADVASFLPDFIVALLVSASFLHEDVRRSVLALIRRPSYRNLEKLFSHYGKTFGMTHRFPSPSHYLPKGIFSNERLEQVLRKNLSKNRLSNDFVELYQKSGKALYIVAANLDTAERVVFGYNQNNHLSISQAVQASTALPAFYRPARLKGVDYIDGGVRKTANIDVGVESGADLIICYNPFRPFYNSVVSRYSQEKGKQIVEGRYLSDQGLLSIINQVFRILLHTRLQYAIDLYRRDPRFQGDIILVEPTEYDYQFFGMNPFSFWVRQQAAKRGHDSVKESIEKRYPLLRRILQAHGIELRKPSLDEEPLAESPKGPHAAYFPDRFEQNVMKLAG
ncbi:MAG: patatin-like phospholipase family protein [bacterium]